MYVIFQVNVNLFLAFINHSNIQSGENKIVKQGSNVDFSLA